VVAIHKLLLESQTGFCKY
jgi:hypothetical protein